MAKSPSGSKLSRMAGSLSREIDKVLVNNGVDPSTAALARSVVRQLSHVVQELERAVEFRPKYGVPIKQKKPYPRIVDVLRPYPVGTAMVRFRDSGNTVFDLPVQSDDSTDLDELRRHLDSHFSGSVFIGAVFKRNET